MPLAGNTPRYEAPDVIGRKLEHKALTKRKFSSPTERRRHRASDNVLSAEITCVNGLFFKLRVGARCGCMPKSNEGPWTHVEVLGPNRSLSALAPYKSGNSLHVAYAIYQKVPVDLLNSIISRNGGEEPFPHNRGDYT